MFLLMSENVSENQVCLFKAGVFKLISAGPVSVPVLATPNQGLTKQSKNFQAGVLKQVGAKLYRTLALQDRVW